MKYLTLVIRDDSEEKQEAKRVASLGAPNDKKLWPRSRVISKIQALSYVIVLLILGIT